MIKSHPLPPIHRHTPHPEWQVRVLGGIGAPGGCRALPEGTATHTGSLSPKHFRARLRAARSPGRRRGPGQRWLPWLGGRPGLTPFPERGHSRSPPSEPRLKPRSTPGSPGTPVGPTRHGHFVTRALCDGLCLAGKSGGSARYVGSPETDRTMPGGRLAQADWL